LIFPRLRGSQQHNSIGHLVSTAVRDPGTGFTGSSSTGTGVTTASGYDSKRKAERGQDQQAVATRRLLCARKSTNADGDAIIIPGEINEDFKDLLQDTTRQAIRPMEQLIRATTDKQCEDDPMNIFTHSTKFPYVALNHVMIGALLTANFSNQPLHAEASTANQSLSIMAFAPTKPTSTETKRQLEETSAVLAEDLVGATMTHRTKVSLTPLEAGSINHGGQAMTTLDLSGNDEDPPQSVPVSKKPRLTKSMHPKYLEQSALGKSWEAQKEQAFGKDNVKQVFTTERRFPPHFVTSFMRPLPTPSTYRRRDSTPDSYPLLYHDSQCCSLEL
jgi:hypothetical protein